MPNNTLEVSIAFFSRMSCIFINLKDMGIKNRKLKIETVNVLNLQLVATQLHDHLQDLFHFVSWLGDLHTEQSQDNLSWFQMLTTLFCLHKH